MRQRRSKYNRFDNIRAPSDIDQNAIKFSKINIFADTLLYIAGYTLEEDVNKLNEDLRSISDWLKWNKLELNVAKTNGDMVMTLKKTLICIIID
jgi:hypothetical protein